MKVLLIFPRVPYPLRDGGAIAMKQIIKGFHAQGIEMTLFFLNTSKHFVNESTIKAEFGKYGKVFSSAIKNEVTIKGALLNLFSKKSYHISRFENTTAKTMLASILKGEQFDVVHFDGLQSSVFLQTVRDNSKAKCVLRQHNVEHLIWERNAENATFPKRFYLTLLARRLKKYEENVLNKFDALVPISEVDGEYFKRFNQNICVASTGIDPPKLKSEFKEQIIFHIGSLDWMPNQEGVKWFLKEVWPLVLTKRPSMKFVLAGRNISAQYQKEVESNAGVQVVGEVEDAEGFMGSNGLMIVPLLAGSGVRIKILEGLALGVPIITTSIGAEGICVEGGKELIIANTPEDFAKAIYNFNSQKFSSISDKARSFIREKFDNNVISQRLLAFYNQIG